ncbi:hypothetical protein D3C71_1072320 [compost metagenome]
MGGQLLDQQLLDLVFAVVGQDVGPHQGHALDGLVHRIAARHRLGRGAGPVHDVQAQHPLGVDGVGVAHPALDAGDIEAARAPLDRRARGGAWGETGGAGGRGVQGAGPVGQACGRRDGDRGGRSVGAACQHFQPPQPARAHGGLAAASLAVDQDGFVGAGGLDEVLRRLAQTPLGRGQTQGLPHRPRQEGINRGGAGPDAFLQPGQDHAVGAGQAGLDGPQNAQARVGGAAGAHRLLAQQPGDQSREVGAADRAQRPAAVDQGRQQRGGGLAVGTSPGVLTGQGLDQGGQGAGGGVGGGGPGSILREGREGLGGEGFQPRGQGAGAGQAGGLPLGQGLAAATGFGGLQQAGLDLGPVARTRAAQGVLLQRRGGVRQAGAVEVEPGQRVLDQAQQGLGLQRGLDEAGGEIDQNPRAHPRQGGAGRGVGDDAPARQPGLDAPGQVQIGGDQGAGLAGAFQRLAHQQGDGRGGFFLGADGQGRQAFQPLVDGVGGLACLGRVGAQAGDLGAPVVGGLGGAQGFVDQTLTGQTARLDTRLDGRLEP